MANDERRSLRVEDVLAKMDPQEVIDLALALGNIDSPTGSEGPAGQFVFDWLAKNSFAPKKYAMIPERFNVAAPLPGTGGGYSLIFNAHLDTTLRSDAEWSARDPKDPLYHSAWVEGDSIYGDGVVNDKGPMAAFLVAAKAIRDAGYPLKGDLIVSAVAGEISREPIDEWQGPMYLSKDLGVRFMVTHGVVADFALVAEGTGFGIVGILPGANPMDVREELRGVLRRVGVPGEVELYVYRPGFEAKGAERLIDTIKRCHAATFPTPPAIVADAVTSMWRDTNAFNEVGIPAISYAPRAQSHAATKSFKLKDLTDAALVYARIAMDLCDQDRPANVPLGAHINRNIAGSVSEARSGRR